MKCDKVQELLFTDYADGEMDAHSAEMLKEHIAGCPKCRKVEQAIMATKVSLKAAKREEPPAWLWARIKESVSTGEAKRTPSAGDILGTLKDFLYGPRYVFARATAIALVILMIVFAGFAVQRHYMTRQISGQDIMWLGSLDINGEDTASDFGTEIEKYFL